MVTPAEQKAMDDKTAAEKTQAEKDKAEADRKEAERKDAAKRAQEEADRAASVPMQAKRYDEIKAALLDPEHQTQQDWHRCIAEMLEFARVAPAGSLFPNKPPEKVAMRVNEIAEAVAAAARKANPARGIFPVHQGRGFWFQSLRELFEIVEPPQGCVRPTLDQMAAAHESDEIRQEIAERYDQRRAAESLGPDAVENK